MIESSSANAMLSRQRFVACKPQGMGKVMIMDVRVAFGACQGAAVLSAVAKHGIQSVILRDSIATLGNSVVPFCTRVAHMYMVL